MLDIGARPAYLDQQYPTTWSEALEVDALLERARAEAAGAGAAQ